MSMASKTKKPKSPSAGSAPETANPGSGDAGVVKRTSAQIRSEEKRALKMSDAEFFKKTIVLAGRSSVRNVVTQTLDSIKARAVQIPDSPQDCLDVCLRTPGAALIVDLNLGADVVFPMLKKIHVEAEGMDRPILLVVQNVTPEIAVAALEYRVGKVMTGQVTVDRMKTQLLQIKTEVTQNFALKRNLAEARAARESGEIGRGIAILESLRDAFPNNPLVTTELAELRIEQEEWTEAEMLLHPLWSAEPPYIRALAGYSRCLMKKGSFDDAIAVLKRGKIMNPFEGERLVALGNILLEVGRTQEADENFSAALALDPGDDRALIGTAKVKLLEEDINAGLRILKETANQRELASVFNAAAIIAIRQERYEHGRDLYRSAMAIMKKTKPILARLVFNLGVAYFKWDKPLESKRCFTAAAKLDPTFDKAKQNAKAMSAKHKDIETKNLVAPEFAEDFAEERVNQAELDDETSSQKSPKKAS
jgi:tetratricopeptide (TPR) repeat protein